MAEWVHGSGRSGKPRPPKESNKNMQCPKCGQEVIKYSDGSLSSHKIHEVKDGKRTGKYKYCEQKKA